MWTYLCERVALLPGELYGKLYVVVYKFNLVFIFIKIDFVASAMI